MSMHGQRGIVGRLRDLVNGIFAVWMREREAERPDAVYERVIGERVRQYAELKRAVAGILYMRNKIEGELRERRAELARLHEDIGRAVKQQRRRGRARADHAEGRPARRTSSAASASSRKSRPSARARRRTW